MQHPPHPSPRLSTQVLPVGATVEKESKAGLRVYTLSKRKKTKKHHLENRCLSLLPLPGVAPVIRNESPLPLPALSSKVEEKRCAGYGKGVNATMAIAASFNMLANVTNGRGALAAMEAVADSFILEPRGMSQAPDDMVLGIGLVVTLGGVGRLLGSKGMPTGDLPVQPEPPTDNSPITTRIKETNTGSIPAGRT